MRPQTVDQARALAVVVAEACVPARRDKVEEWIMLLHATCPHRVDDMEGVAVMMEGYVADLAVYPPDVVRSACDDWRRRRTNGPNWFPSLGELLALCERLVAPRRAMRAALENWMPTTRREDLEKEAQGWLRDAYRAEVDMLRTRKSDPDASSEFAEFAASARAEYKRLITEAREPGA